MAHILVVGSINMDVVLRVAQLPFAGETVRSAEIGYVCGGKGANQAIASARAGARVTMVGAVGHDEMGQTLLSKLSANGIDVSHIEQKQSSTGLAFISVNESGENTIVLHEGANAELSVRDAHLHQAFDSKPDVLIVQNEIPLDVTKAVMQQAHQLGIPVCFNPAPAQDIPKDIFEWVDILIVNQGEASLLSGLTLVQGKDISLAAKHFIDLGVHEVMITLGNKGVFFVNDKGLSRKIDAHRIDVVDSTGAGDTFVGFYVALRAALYPPQHALCYANAAAALSVTRSGAEPSIPSFSEVTTFLSEQQWMNCKNVE
ncbi:MAG: ribokinase [Acidibacillus sp.]|uniref:Ribokinase n=1 Tax=Sulfoacidibacillus ferrooxidans TaxID=2005001 RepID=A0A9X1V9F5_9BACL|nr:ribokinase [Sulfoacidibacillus ferrooxidans]MCI0182548.1 Ribokinase [Sulfoacidibacillus ferrooxidans]MCY0894180.1 ribokinase [Acidibacillus sp.]